MTTKNDDAKEERMRTYLEKVSYYKEPELGVSPVLYAIVLTLVSENESEEEDAEELENKITSSFSNESFPLLNYIKTYPPSVSLTSDILLLETDDDQAARYTKANKIRDILISIENIDDKIENKYLDLYLFERNAYAQNLINKMIESDLFPLTPIVSNEERKLRESEVLTFTSLSASDFYRCDKMQIIEDMIQACTAKLPNFSKKISLGSDSSVTRRKYFRNISKFILPQILSKNVVKEPKILKAYYPHLDELLFVLHWVPPVRRMCNSSWKISNTLIESNVDPKLKSKGKKDKKVKNDILEMTKEDTVTITPAGNAIVLSKYAYSTNHSWVSIYLNDSIIGLRNLGEPVANPPPILDELQPNNESLGQDEEKEEGENDDNEIKDDLECDGIDIGDENIQNNEDPIKNENAIDSNRCSVFLETDDDVRITVFSGPKPEVIVKPDKFGTVCLMVCMPSLMTITACSNGMVRIATTKIKDETTTINHWGNEVARYISNGGTITRSLSGGLYRKDVIAPSGHRYLYKANDESYANVSLSEADGFHYIIKNNCPSDWHSLSIGIDGSISFLDIDKRPIYSENSASLLADDTLQVYTDAETLARVSKYSDGRVITDYTDGLREVVTTDGTRFMTHPSGNVVFITKAGYPSIEVDIEIDLMCDGHSKGLQVALSKGGFKVRTRLVCPDGSALMIKYDTRVTAKTNGTLKLVRRDKSVIIANDDGNATYFPRYSWNTTSEKEFHDENSDSTIIIDKIATEFSQIKPLKSTASTVKFNVEAGMSGADTNLNASQSTLLHESISNFSSSKFKLSVIKDQSINEKNSKISKNTKFDNSVKENSVVESRSSISSKEINRKILDSKYTFNIYNYTVHIIDHEYNSFEINLRDPLNPKRSLAGEVQGLKATAISDGPIEPRAFVLSRNGDTTEIISSQIITSNEDLVELSQDASKFVSDAPLQPADFSSSQQNNYFRRQKIGATDDSYNFDEVFKERLWHNRKRPATTSLILARSSSSNTHDKQKNKKIEVSPRVFDTCSVLERNPLSSEGYKQLNNGMQAYDEFKVNRLDAINRFTIHDSRSSEDIDIELKVQAKVKQAYKIMIKKLEQGRRDDEKKDKDSADDFPAFAEDEEEKKDDPEDIEIKDAFYTHAHAISDTISFPDTRLALIQLFNMNIKYDTISSFLDEDSLNILKTDKNIQFSFIQFSDIYFRMKTVINDSDKKISDYSVSVTDEANDNQNSPITENNSFYNNITTPTTYWDSSIGKKASLTLQKSAVPLDLRPLDWQQNESLADDDDFINE